MAHGLAIETPKGVRKDLTSLRTALDQITPERIDAAITLADRTMRGAGVNSTQPGRWPRCCGVSEAPQT